MTHTRVLSLLITLALVPCIATAGTAADRQAQFLKALDIMMVELAPQTAQSSATVRKEYRAYLDLLVLNEYAALITDATRLRNRDLS